MLGWLPGESLRRAQLDERVDWELRSALVSRLVGEKPLAEIGHMLVSIVVAAMVWSSLGPTLTLAWSGAVIGTAANRVRARRKLQRFGGPLERQLQTIQITVLSVGLAWGVGALVLAPLIPLTRFLLIMLAFCGVAAVASMSLVADRRAFWYLVTAMLVPLTVGLLRVSAGAEGWYATVLMALYLATLGQFYHRAHERFVEALRTSKRFEFSEEEVVRERGFLDALISSAPMGIVAVSRHGRVLGVNPAFEQLFGWKNADLVGRSLDEMIVPEEGREEATRLEQEVAAGRPIHAEVERVRSDGRRVWTREAAAPVHGIAQGGVFVLYQDITAMRHARDAQRDAEEQYRLLVETASDLVFRLDAEGRWTFLNEAARPIYQCHPENLLGRPFSECAHPDYVDTDLRALETVLAGESLRDHETVHLGRAGSPRTLSFSVSPLRDAGGAVIGAHGIARDITERAEVRRTLSVARDTAEHATAMKSAFLANMSHEVRTPLNGVLGMIELLLDSRLSREQRRQAELIRSSGGALLGIINDILDFSKIEAGHLTIEAVAFDLPALLDDIGELYRANATEKGIQLVADADRSIPPVLVGDPVRIRQVLSNLLGNAIKFTAEGSVTLTTRLAGLSGPEATVRFAVRDTGIGIPEAARAHIFDEFAQADVSTSRKFGGTGLGLAICRNLVTLMRGELALESEEGTGSEFSFALTLPVGTAVTTVEPAVPRAAPARVLRILVAEDNPVNREVASQMLRRRGHTVTVVEDGQAALDAVERDTFDVVLMDVQMPVMDGLRATAAIRALGPRGQVQIVAATANATTAERERCFAAGMNGYLTKPFRPVDLFAAVERAEAGAPPAAAPAAPNGAPVDLEAFRADLAAAGVASAMPRMLEIFVEDAPMRHAALDGAFSRGEAQAIHSAAHAYKSSAGSIRADALAALLQSAERAAGAGDVAGARATRGELRAEHERVLMFLKAEVHA